MDSPSDERLRGRVYEVVILAPDGAAGDAKVAPVNRSDRVHPGPGRPSVTASSPLVRDPWAWACVLALVPLVIKSLGGALGEPVADDWDFVAHALFRPFSFFDGGGSSAFWRPIP